jgi:glycosyltransferase involved in cell wall biosynthesis
MIPTYNCAHLAGATIDSVLAQDPGPDAMEVVVVDDASEDDIGAVVARYDGRVRLHRQARNLGVPHNLTDAIERSRGEIVHVLHGDDQVLPGFYEAMERAFADPATGAAWCRQIFMNADGEWVGISELELPEGVIEDAAAFLGREQRIMTPSMCVRRHVYEAVGGFQPALSCAEDWEMWVRIASRFPVYHLRAPLAVYRMHDQSNTGRNLRNAGETRAAAEAIALFGESLRPADAASVMREARTVTARGGLRLAARFARAGDVSATFAQVRAALALSRSPRVLVAVARVLLYLAAGVVRPAGGG